jgi:hypothetical protein
MVKIKNMGMATGVVPELQYVMDKLAIKKPLFEYEVSVTREVSDTVWVSGVQVSQDAEVVGDIEFRREAGRINSEGERPDVFLVETHHIKKERGRRNTVVTSDANVAVKTAVKHFAPMSEGDLAQRAHVKVMDLLDTMCYRARSCLQDVITYNGQEMMCYLIERFGRDNNDYPVPQSVVIHADKIHLYDKFLAGKQIQTAYNGDRLNRKGYAVWTLPDGSYRVLHMNYKYMEQSNILTRYRNFDDLPQGLQSKIAVLKIAEKDDPIMDIGVKLNLETNIMYVME